MTAPPATTFPTVPTARTPAESPSADPESPLGVVGTFVDGRVDDLQDRLLRDPQDPDAVTALERLHGAIGAQPDQIGDVRELTSAPELRHGRPDDQDPSPAEYAAHVAITLFAAHQTAKGDPMHRRGSGLGAALRRLHAGDPLSVPEPILARFRTLGTAESFGELVGHLREVVQLLRSADTPLDYGLLAQQLLAWQDNPFRVRMTWGREFYRRGGPDPAGA